MKTFYVSRCQGKAGRHRYGSALFDHGGAGHGKTDRFLSGLDPSDGRPSESRTIYGRDPRTGRFHYLGCPPGGVTETEFHAHNLCLDAERLAQIVEAIEEGTATGEMLAEAHVRLQCVRLAAASLARLEQDAREQSDQEV
ncbi:MAG: hypothetical protein R3247_01375 [Rhodothermales bacterium]|nr:hypothetical protein [Rhodothermales bacterium]